MARQFNKNDVIRLLLNVETSVVEEALRDERLADQAIWIKKQEILEAIEDLAAIFGETELEKRLQDFFRPLLENAISTAEESNRILREQGGIINRIMAAMNTVFIVFLEHWMRVIETEEVPAPLPGPFPKLIEFDFQLPDPGPTPVQQIRAAISSLRLCQQELAAATIILAKEQLVQPVTTGCGLALSRGLVGIKQAEDHRGRAQSVLQPLTLG